MGYTHYWKREKEIDRETFKKIIQDFRILLPYLREVGIELADGDGKGYPRIDREEILFNGYQKCGHPENKGIVIPWPAENARGVTALHNSRDEVSGRWFAGVLIETRICNGDCSYESFSLPRVMDTRSSPDSSGKYFDCCKTAFRPYDLVVTALLVIAKNYLGKRIRVKSDGEMTHWFDAMMLCKLHLGYGLSFMSE